jgi:hypothetical protein
MSKKKIKVFEYEGKRITFDFGDGSEMVNATEMVKAFKGKRLDNFMRLKQTKEFIETLQSDTSHSREHFVKAVSSGKYELRGTWVNDVLALKLAAWLNPSFEVWVYGKIKELLTTGKTTLSNDKIIIDKKTFQFYLEKQKEGVDTFNYFIQSLLNPPNED